MADNGMKKVNKNPKRLTKDTAAIIIAVLLIALYVFYECYVVTHVEVETITARTSTVYETIDATALVLRDEHTLSANSSALTVACVDDGEKVKASGNIAMTFSSSENAKNYAKLNELHSELDYYINLQSKSAGAATDVESIDRDILEDINSYVRNTAGYSQGALSASVKDLNDKLTRRRMIIGEKIDFSNITESLEKQINSINSEDCAPSGYVTAQNSGIFSSYTDGCESLFDCKKINKLNTKTLDKLISQAEKAKSTDSIGKIITDYEWYFCCKVTADQVKNINNGDTLQVAVKNTGSVLNCKVLSGASLDLGTEEAVLVLRCSEMNGAITSMRLEDIEIRYGEHSGIKVPSSAIHIDKDGNKGIYALVANQAVFRQGKIIYSTKDFSVFKYEPESNDSIRLYDQIITKGKDLHDGKVYT